MLADVLFCLMSLFELFCPSLDPPSRLTDEPVCPFDEDAFKLPLSCPEPMVLKLPSWFILPEWTLPFLRGRPLVIGAWRSGSFYGTISKAEQPCDAWAKVFGSTIIVDLAIMSPAVSARAPSSSALSFIYFR